MENRIRPQITEDRVEQIRGVIRGNPEWKRTRISQYLCRIWHWQAPNGKLEYIAYRDLLRELDKAGRIKLPAPLKVSVRPVAPT